MKMVSFSFGSFRKAVSLTLLVSLLSVAASVQPAQADSVSDLQRQQALLEQQAAQAQAQASRPLAGNRVMTQVTLHLMKIAKARARALSRSHQRLAQ